MAKKWGGPVPPPGPPGFDATADSGDIAIQSTRDGFCSENF